MSLAPSPTAIVIFLYCNLMILTNSAFCNGEHLAQITAILTRAISMKIEYAKVSENMCVKANSPRKSAHFLAYALHYIIFSLALKKLLLICNVLSSPIVKVITSGVIS